MADELVIIRNKVNLRGRFSFYLADYTPGRHTVMASFSEEYNVVVGRPAFPLRDTSVVKDAIRERFQSANFGLWMGNDTLYLSDGDRGMLELLAERQ